jgi:hypothetical protein
MCKYTPLCPFQPKRKKFRIEVESRSWVFSPPTFTIISILICLLSTVYGWDQQMPLVYHSLHPQKKCPYYNNHLKAGIEPTPEKSCISNIPQTMDNICHNIGT